MYSGVLGTIPFFLCELHELLSGTESGVAAVRPHLLAHCDHLLVRHLDLTDVSLTAREDDIDHDICPASCGGLTPAVLDANNFNVGALVNELETLEHVKHAVVLNGGACNVSDLLDICECRFLHDA